MPRSGSDQEPCCHSGEVVNLGDTERVVSTVVGAAAVLYGLSRLSLSSIVALVAGGALLYRGMTGHCSLYEALDVSTVDEPENQGGKQPRAGQRVADVSLAATGEANPRPSRPAR